MDDDRIIALEAAVKDFKERIESIENVLSNGLTKDLKDTRESATELKRLVQGDPALKVPSLRDIVSGLAHEVNNIKTSMDRAKWFMIGSGVTNLGSAAVFISQIFGGSP